MFKHSQTLLGLAGYLIMWGLVYHRALDLGFLADDSWAFYFAQKDWLIPNPESPHYPPLHFVIYWGLFQAFGFHPLPYHLFVLGIALINGLLVKTLADQLEMEPWQGWAAGLLVLFNSGAAEIYLWFCIVNTAVMTGLTVAGLACLARWRRTGDKSWGAGYLAAIVLASLMDGKGLILPLLGWIWDYVGPSASLRQRQISPGARARFHFLAFGLPATLILGRYWLGVKSATIHLPLAEKWRTLKVTLVTTYFQGLEDLLWRWLAGFPGIWKQVPPTLWLLLVAIWGAGVILSRSTERRRLTALTLIWVGACLPHTLTANLQFRYFFFPGVFAALVLVQLLRIFGQRLASPGKARALAGGVMAGCLLMNIWNLQLSINSFQEASQIYEAGIKTIQDRLPTMAPGSQLIFIDFPFYLYNQQAGGSPRPNHIPYVYVFPQAMPYHLVLLYGIEPLSVTFMKSSSAPPGKFAPMGEQFSAARLAELTGRPHTYVFQYLYGKKPRFVFYSRGSSD